MSKSKVSAVFLAEPRRDGEYAEGARVGFDGVTRIEQRLENVGTDTVLWFDIYNDDGLHMSLNWRYVAAVHYEHPIGGAS